MQSTGQKSRTISLYGPDPAEAKKGAFLWMDALRTGHDSIDRQHQDLYESFRGISQLLEDPDISMNYWFGMVMRKTDDYVLTHFADEEKLMVSVNYPDVHKHKLQHMEIIETLKRHQTTIKQLKTDGEKVAEARNLLQFLNDWLNTHVLEEDKALVAFINR